MVPADLRHFEEAAIGTAQIDSGEAHDAARNDPQSRMAAHLLALVEQQLHPHTNTQQRRPRGHGIPQRLLEAGRAQIRGRIAERAHARQHDARRAREPRRRSDHLRRRARRLQRLVDAAQIPTP